MRVAFLANKVPGRVTLRASRKVRAVEEKCIRSATSLIHTTNQQDRAVHKLGFG
jgi:hypothetical protein